jgi:hypothetical protein
LHHRAPRRTYRAAHRSPRLAATVPIPEREFALLRGLGILAPLPIATLETLAARAEWLTIEAGDVIVREGDPGDRCYAAPESLTSRRSPVRAGHRPSTRKALRTCIFHHALAGLDA